MTNQHRNRHRISCSATLHNSNFHLSNEREPYIGRTNDDEIKNFSNELKGSKELSSSIICLAKGKYGTGKLIRRYRNNHFLVV